MDGERTEDPSRGDQKATSYSSLREGEANDCMERQCSLALVNHSNTEPHWKQALLLEARDERLEERLEACAQVHLRLFAVAVEELGESAKSRTQQIVVCLVDIPDVLFNEGAIQRIQHVLGI